jgi:hypothetical protein
LVSGGLTGSSCGQQLRAEMKMVNLCEQAVSIDRKSTSQFGFSGSVLSHEGQEKT